MRVMFELVFLVCVCSCVLHSTAGESSEKINFCGYVDNRNSVCTSQGFLSHCPKQKGFVVSSGANRTTAGSLDVCANDTITVLYLVVNGSFINDSSSDRVWFGWENVADFRVKITIRVVDVECGVYPVQIFSCCTRYLETLLLVDDTGSTASTELKWIYFFKDGSSKSMSLECQASGYPQDITLYTDRPILPRKITNPGFKNKTLRTEHQFTDLVCPVIPNFECFVHTFDGEPISKPAVYDKEICPPAPCDENASTKIVFGNISNSATVSVCVVSYTEVDACLTDLLDCYKPTSRIQVYVQPQATDRMFFIEITMHDIQETDFRNYTVRITLRNLTWVYTDVYFELRLEDPPTLCSQSNNQVVLYTSLQKRALVQFCVQSFYTLHHVVRINNKNCSVNAAEENVAVHVVNDGRVYNFTVQIDIRTVKDFQQYDVKVMSVFGFEMIFTFDIDPERPQLCDGETTTQFVTSTLKADKIIEVCVISLPNVTSSLQSDKIIEVCVISLPNVTSSLLYNDQHLSSDQGVRLNLHPTDNRTFTMSLAIRNVSLRHFGKYSVQLWYFEDRITELTVYLNQEELDNDMTLLNYLHWTLYILTPILILAVVVSIFVIAYKDEHRWRKTLRDCCSRSRKRSTDPSSTAAEVVQSENTYAVISQFTTSIPATDNPYCIIEQETLEKQVMYSI